MKARSIQRHLTRCISGPGTGLPELREIITVSTIHYQLVVTPYEAEVRIWDSDTDEWNIITSLPLSDRRVPVTVDTVEFERRELLSIAVAVSDQTLVDPDDFLIEGPAFNWSKEWEEHETK